MPAARPARAQRWSERQARSPLRRRSRGAGRSRAIPVADQGSRPRSSATIVRGRTPARTGSRTETRLRSRAAGGRSRTSRASPTLQPRRRAASARPSASAIGRSQGMLRQSRRETARVPAGRAPRRSAGNSCARFRVRRSRPSAASGRALTFGSTGRRPHPRADARQSSEGS